MGARWQGGSGLILVSLTAVSCGHDAEVLETARQCPEEQGTFEEPPPLDEPASIAKQRPAPLGGEGLLVTHDGLRVVASDPDRDRVHIALIESRMGITLQSSTSLEPGSQPSRLAEDGDGRAHIVLRGSGELLTIDLETSKLVERRWVCDQPRGVVYEATTDLVHVACAEGRLVSLPAAGGEPTRVLALDADLRDVIVYGDGLMVSRFRSAEVLQLDGTGKLVQRLSPASASSDTKELCDRPAKDFAPTVAWKLMAARDGQPLLLHQRAETTALDLEPTRHNPYSGGQRSCFGIVHSVISNVLDEAKGAAPPLANTTLATNAAISPDGQQIAVVAGLSALSFELDRTRTVQVFQRSEVSAVFPENETVDGSSACASGSPTHASGEPTAAEFTPDGNIVSFSRQPANLTLIDPLARYVLATLTLEETDSTDTGHQLFHQDTGSGIACASCHPEAGEDGHTWRFVGFGPRRTQELRGGVLGRAPFHWEGDLDNFSTLVDEVMVRRMGGRPLGVQMKDALASWIDAQPSLTRSDFDAEASERGRLLFESKSTQCSTCHTGAELTNNGAYQVGTGERLKVPTLGGISFRGPFMHDGCAPTLLDRFGPCGGGDAHGKTSQLSPNEIGDLIEYMKSL